MEEEQFLFELNRVSQGISRQEWKIRVLIGTVYKKCNVAFPYLRDLLYM